MRSNSTESPAKAQNAPPDSVELSESQLKGVKVETIESRDFPIEKSAVGSIDFNEDLLDAGLYALSGPNHRAVRQDRR